MRFCSCLPSNLLIYFLLYTDAREHSLEPIVEEREQTDEEEAGSFSPVLMHGSGDEEAIDPEEDMAELVHFFVLFLSSKL